MHLLKLREFCAEKSMNSTDSPKKIKLTNVLGVFCKEITV